MSRRPIDWWVHVIDEQTFASRRARVADFREHLHLLHLRLSARKNITPAHHQQFLGALRDADQWLDGLELVRGNAAQEEHDRGLYGALERLAGLDRFLPETN